METSFFKKMISISFLFIFMFTMNVQAKEVTYTGNGQNLQKFIDDNVESGDTVKLTSPSYTFSTLEIKKDLTLEGVGNAEWSTSSGIKNYPTTRITGEIIIKDSAENVVLKNIFMQNGKVTQSDLSIIKVTTQVNLTLDNFANHYVTGNTVDNVNTLNLDEGSDNSKVIVKNSILIPLYDVFLVEAGDIKFNIDNCYLTGKRIFDFDASSNAQNNSLTINNSYLEGTAATNAAKIKTDEVIAIKNQDKLTIDINNSTLVGEKTFSSSSPTHIFDFEGENSNVTINIKDNSILRDSDERDSNIFKFGQSKKNSNNVINVDNTVKMTKEEDDETFTIKDKYSIDSVDSVVVGIYDFTGNLTIKVYDKNDVLESELDEIVKKIPKNYRFIGWYTDKEFKDDNVFEVKTLVSENIDLYPKTIELITITIKDQEFIIDKGSNLNSLKEDDKQRLENVLKANDKQFKDFAIEGQEDRYTKDSIFNESVTLIPKYTVDVTIKEEGSQDVFHKITLDEGQSLKNVSSEDTTYSNLINDKYFNCFYKENQKFDTDTPIDKNIELTIKRNVKVSVNSNDYYVLKDSKLSDDNELNKALEELAKGTNKQFKTYYDNTNKREIEAQSKADMDMEIIAQFTVDVTIDKEKFTIDEGQTLSDIKGEDLDRLNTLKNGEYFSRYLKDNETFDEKTSINENTTLTIKRNVKITIKSDSQSTEKYIEEGSTLSSSQDVINALTELGNVQHKHLKEYYNETEKRHITFKDLETYEITKDSVIVGRYEVKVTIEEDGETKRVITIDEKNNLSSASGDDEKYLKDLNEDPYFAGFIKGSDEFNMDTEVSEDITISIKRNVKITINGAYYYIEKGKTFGESSSILNALKELSNVKDKALKHYYNETDHSPILFDEVESFIATKDIVITPRYTVEVTIIDGNENKVIIIDENQGLETATSEDKEYLDNLINDPYFSRFVDEDGNTFTTNTSVTHDITLTVMRNNKVTIDSKDYYLEKGLKLSEKEEIANALESLKNVQGKHFKEYYVGEEVIAKDYKPTKDIVIGAHYTVVVTIDGEEFTIDEGESIKDIKGADLERLNKLKNGKYFASYLKDGQEFTDSTIVSEDTTLTIKRNVKVVVNDTEYYVLKDSILSSNTELNEALEELAKGTNKQFKIYYDVTNERAIDIQSKADKDMKIVAQFTVNVVIDGQTFTIDEGKSIKDIEGSDLERLNTLKNGNYFSRYLKDNATFKEDTKITENTTLTIKRNVKVIIEDKDYYIEDGLKLKDNADVVKALEDAKNLTTKQFMEYYDVDTQEKVEEPLELDAKEDLKIKARYKIDVKINGKDYMLEENSTLESLPIEAKEELQKMREVSNKQFVKFVDKKGNEVEFNKTLTENLEIIPTYNVKVTIDEEEFIIPEGTTLKDIEGSDLERLNTLKNGKYFSRYLKDNETFKEDTKIDENTILTIKRNVKVVIEDKDYYLEKGNKLSSDKAIVDALEGLKKVTNKQFKEYVKDSEILENPLELVANDNMVIKANYEVEVTIDDKKYTLQEGQSLNDLEKEVLDKLKEIMKKDTFAKFVNSKNEEILLDTKLMENTTITAKYNVLVKIGDSKFIVTEGMTLNDLSKEDKLRLEELKNNHAENLKFKGYKNVKTGEEFTDKTPITSDIELELVFEEIKEEETTPEVKPDDKPTTGETSKPDTNKPSNPNNDVPKTFDNIITYITLGITSLIALIGGVFFIRRKSLNK